ncbi:MAG: PilN domain-containing protein [Candidatus Omnitrophica bacterium]|nr:PilN domain-containing protein [Candidatus Omnitrophota bacterium]
MKRIAANIKKNGIFVLQVEDQTLKILKAGPKGASVTVSVQEAIKISGGLENPDMAIQAKILLSNLGYRNQPLIFCLPRKSATCHYLKIPSKKTEEIESMIAYRAPRLLPYEISELVTGYELIRSDNQGYSHINLSIIHRKIVDKLTELFSQLGGKNIFFALSPYGVSNLFFYDNPKSKELAMLIDADLNRIEVSIVRQEKLVFSRSFMTPDLSGQSDNLFLDEIKKTCDSYKKETAIELPQNCYLFAEQALAARLTGILTKAGMKTTGGQQSKRIISQTGELDSLLNSKNSYFNLLGLPLIRLPQSLNLLPLNLKNQMQKADRLKEVLTTGLLVVLILGVWFLAGFKNYKNKLQHLSSIESQLQEISKEAAPLERMERRLRILKKQAQDTTPVIDFLYASYKNIPEGVYLRNLSYENQEVLILKGEAPELNKVFEYVNRLEKSEALKGYEAEVKQATKKRSESSLVSFEIVCQKR